MSTKELIEEITSLPIEERAVVLDSILRSLNPPDPDIDRKWADVAKHRLADLKSGHVKAADGNKIFEKIWKQFTK